MQANVVSHRASPGGTSGRSKREGHFSLAEHFPPVPPKLVQKIQAGEFVDLAELLPDNMEMVRRAGIEGQGQSQRQLRRVVNLLTWVQCFSTYAAILGEAQPHRSRDLLAYMRLIVREAQRHGGEGWRSYDALFRKFAALNPSVKWGQPLPSLYSMHFLAARSSAASCCDHCLEGDHSTGECALSPLPQPEPVASYNSARSFRPATVNAATSRRVGQGSTAGQIDFADRPVCKRWNFAKGGCKGLPDCDYRHACLRCERRNHKVGDCPETSAAVAHQESAQSGLPTATTHLTKF